MFDLFWNKNSCIFGIQLLKRTLIHVDSVQLRFTKQLHSLDDLERLEWLNLQSPKLRRLHSDTVFELVHFLERLSVHLYVGRWSWLDAVHENFALFGADFHAVFSRCFL